MNKKMIACSPQSQIAKLHPSAVVSGVYFHGDVQEFFYRKMCIVPPDLVSLLNYDEFECKTWDDGDPMPVIEGIYDCDVVGYPNKCRAYMWVRHYGDRGYFMPRGLIVDVNDTDAVAHAEEKFNKKDVRL